jgi:predicted nucleic acid-binding protein
MKGRSFLDTNILVYTDDADAGDKADIAIDLIEQGMRSQLGVISTQVMQEYYVAVTRKLQLQPELARQRLEFFSLLPCYQTTQSDVFDAINLSLLYKLSFWDSLILQAAKRSSCSYLLSEDLNHNQTIEGVTIINPFK